jgi:hypothetical protein
VKKPTADKESCAVELAQLSLSAIWLSICRACAIEAELPAIHWRITPAECERSHAG